MATHPGVGSSGTRDTRNEVQLQAFRCTTCGYGASCRLAPERCPMCSGTVWVSRPARRYAIDADWPLTREER
jgi:rubredoxin